MKKWGLIKSNKYKRKNKANNLKDDALVFFNYPNIEGYLVGL